MRVGASKQGRKKQRGDILRVSQLMCFTTDISVGEQHRFLRKALAKKTENEE